jgi:AcrR family transcriptional regulator
MSDGPPLTLDKRVIRSKELVLKETYKLLSEGGIGGVSVDEVSRRSGVSKTTIYRHWPSRSALLLDACSKIGGRAQRPDSGSLEGDMSTLAERLAEELSTGAWAVVLPSIIDAAERDPEIAQLHASLHAGFMQPFFEAIVSARDRGELTQDRDPAKMVAAIVGPLFYRRWFSKEPIDKEFVSDVVRRAMI